MTGSFSVVTPSLNQGQFIRATIESVLTQEIIDIQYLVMDGGSNDGTLEILKDYGNRLRFVSELDQGTADAINKGLARCDGDLIGWLNSDDIYYAGTLSRVRELFGLHPEVDVIYGRAEHIDEHGNLIEEYQTAEWAFEDLINHCIISQPAAFFRRRVVEKFGLLDKRRRYCLDYDFWIRLARNGANFLFVPELFAATRLHARAKTVASRLQCHREINDIMVEHLGYVPTRWISNYAHAIVERSVNRSQRNIAFLALLVFHCLLADLRWNRRVSRATVRMLVNWIPGIPRKFHQLS
jgi:glycosyltransferase involved in cell wall biosynthesis